MSDEYHQAPSSIPKAVTGPLIPAAKVKIVGGLSEYALEDPPAYGEERTYIVKAWCKKVHLDEIDGEPRMTVDMLQTSIWERGKVPIVDERQPGLFPAADEPDEDEAPAQGELDAEPAADEPEDNVRTGPWSGPDSPAFSGADEDEDADGNQS